MDKKYLIFLVVVFFVSIGVASAFGDFSILNSNDAKTVEIDVVNVSDGELFKNKATELINGDAVICFTELRDNVQYSKGVHIDYWYVGNGSEDIEPHHTQITKAQVFYNGTDGDLMTIEKTDGFSEFPLVDGYTPYKAKVWYKEI